MRRAFTVIEMLVVITVVMVLMGLLLKGAQLAREGARRTRSQTIVGAVANGLAAAATEGVTPPLTPHPLASTVTALRFKRGAIDPIRLDPARASLREGPLTGPDPYNGGASDSNALWSSERFTEFDGNTAVTTSPPGGWYLMGSDRAQFPSSGAAHGQLDARLLGNDVFAETGAPMFYGCKRELMWVIGAAHPQLTRYLTAPQVDRAGAFRQRQTQAPQLSTAITTGSYPALVVDPGGTGVTSAQAFEETQVALRRALASTWDQLQGLGALRQPRNDTDLVIDGRLWTSGGIAAAYTPGTVDWMGSGWRPYQLRGLAIYDAWDREILVSQGADQRIRVLSAGKDACVRIDPGSDRVFQTALNRRVLAWCNTWPESAKGGGLAGDDRDATRDNISIGVEAGDYFDILTAPEAAFFGVSP